MTDAADKSLWFGELRVTRHEVVSSGSSLWVSFRVCGPNPGSWEASDHVVFARDGDTRKLRILESSAGTDAPDSAFEIVRVEWPGGPELQIRYGHDGQHLDGEAVRVPAAVTDQVRDPSARRGPGLLSDVWARDLET
ncbi:hypothetical protein [Nocardioides scoriae]|uniref:hypothetical protein n=1 Tax=Nocardioides scoriae TaxID=642780 RepID=UPI0012F752C2|nr:hypothetical protein [Nocardioides scoriae]